MRPSPSAPNPFAAFCHRSTQHTATLGGSTSAGEVSYSRGGGGGQVVRWAATHLPLAVPAPATFSAIVQSAVTGKSLSGKLSCGDNMRHAFP